MNCHTSTILVAISMAQRLRYTHDELNQYFDRVALPKPRRTFNVSKLSDNDKLSYLRLLHKHHLVQIPWENLTQHYSWHRTVTVHPRLLFNKIVHNPGRGGYCMEANTFYHHVLLTLGFDVYMTGARIHDPSTASYGGWTHCVNLCTIAGVRYLLDGGLGPNGPPIPFALTHGVPTTHIPHTASQMRLVYEPIPQNLNQASKVWVFQHRFDDGQDWVPQYCFPELEFLPEDIHAMNFAPWLDPQKFFTHKVVCARFTTEREKGDGPPPRSAGEAEMEGEIDGSLSLNQDVLKWRRRGEKVLEWGFETEQDRLDALERYFGIRFAEEDVQSIKGTAAAIGARGPGNA